MKIPSLSQCLLILLTSLTLGACVVDGERVEGRYEEERQRQDQPATRDEERAERLDREAQCTVREPSGECRER